MPISRAAVWVVVLSGPALAAVGVSPLGETFFNAVLGTKENRRAEAVIPASAVIVDASGRNSSASEKFWKHNVSRVVNSAIPRVDPVDQLQSVDESATLAAVTRQVFNESAASLRQSELMAASILTPASPSTSQLSTEPSLNESTPPRRSPAIAGIELAAEEIESPVDPESFAAAVLAGVSPGFADGPIATGSGAIRTDASVRYEAPEPGFARPVGGGGSAFAGTGGSGRSGGARGGVRSFFTDDVSETFDDAKVIPAPGFAAGLGLLALAVVRRRAS